MPIRESTLIISIWDNRMSITQLEEGELWALPLAESWLKYILHILKMDKLAILCRLDVKIPMMRLIKPSQENIVNLKISHGLCVEGTPSCKGYILNMTLLTRRIPLSRAQKRNSGRRDLIITCKLWKSWSLDNIIRMRGRGPQRMHIKGIGLWDIRQGWIRLTRCSRGKSVSGIALCKKGWKKNEMRWSKQT